MMREFFLLFSLLLFAQEAFAEDQAIIGSHDLLRGDFSEEKHLSGFNSPLISHGRFTIAPLQGLIWEVLDPFASKIVITPLGLVQIIGGHAVTELSAQKIPFMLHLYDMLGGTMAGNYQAMESDFDVVRTNSGEGWQVVLTPHQKDNPAMPYQSIIISGRRFVDKVILQKADGDTDIFNFKNTHMLQTPPNATEQAAFAAVKS